MLERFDGVVGKLTGETQMAICMNEMVWHRDGDTVVEFQNDMWIPKSNLHDDSLVTVEEAVRGEEVEIYVKNWWLMDQL